MSIRVNSYKVYGPLNVRARGRFEYFIAFFDDYSRHGYIICCFISPRHLKSSKNFEQVKKHLDKNIKSLWSDQGGAYLSGDFNKYLLDNEILS